MVQAYVGEEKKAWEDLRHGLILGTRNFIEKIKSRYSLEKPDREIPQKRKVLRSSDPQALLKRAVCLLQIREEDLVSPARLRGEERDKRDLVIYLFWITGHYTNKEIGNLFALTYFSISKIVMRIQSALSTDRKTKERLKKINSLFKV
jgi:hypothetical protein